ncbi:hypothetical protein QR680_011804 [Steinernema hermaphroditum]|uniref:LRAT domain-containing protein n=1 Tax=Steinernema hermaphroditum TaxID=289476 RepID=A0AA39I120_9BILA|nr:hypothetical protein QR680_011804 [Steinernema hermaphroditum]
MSKTWVNAKGLLPLLKVGDIIEFPQVLGIAMGRAIFIGEKKIIHFSPGTGSRGYDVKIKTLKDEDTCHKNNSSDSKWIPFPADRIKERALRLLDEKADLSSMKNGEDFVNWCRYGNPDERRPVKINERGPGYKSEYMSAKELATHLEAGDLLERENSAYEHWLVYVGLCMGYDHVVFELTQSSGSSSSSSGKAIIRWIDLFELEGSYRVNNSSDERWRPLPSEEIRNRAIGKYNEEQKDYRIWSNNCEHFVNWCRYGRSVSFQVENKSSLSLLWKYLTGSGGCC